MKNNRDIRYVRFRFITAAFFLLLGCMSLSAQTGEVDSLKELLETQLADTSRIDVLLQLADKTRITEPQQSLGYSNLAHALATDVGDKNRLAQAFKWMAIVYERQGNYVDATDYYTRSLETFRDAGDKLGESNILNNLGVIYNNQGDDAKALESFLASLRIGEEMNDTRRAGTALLNVGSVYMKKPQTHASAIESFEKAIPLMQESDYLLGEGVVYINLGETFLDMSRIDEDPADLDSAVYYLDKAREIFRNTVPEYLSYTLNLIGEAQTAQGKYGAAVETQREAYDVGVQINDRAQQGLALTGLGQTYLARGSFSQAVATFSRAEEIFKDLKAKDGLSEVYEGLASAYNGLGDYARAYEFQTLFTSYKDTLYNIATANTLKDQQFAYDLDKKQAELELQKTASDLETSELQQKIVRRNFLIAIVIFVIVVAMGIFVQYRITQQSKERQKNLERQQKLNAQLKKIDKMKDEFLANTSHELRTPLNGIIGLADSLKDGAAGELPVRAKDNLEMIAASGRRLSNLVNDILDFSKLQSHQIELQIEPVDMHKLSEMVCQLSTPLIGDKNLTLINDIPTDVKMVDADENRVQQIMHNLLGNAIKFTEEGSVRVYAEEEDGYLAISISDTGIGIPKDKFGVIFETFQQGDGSTAREFGGTGLGLSVTKSLVDIHGGTVGVESEIGEGSIFTFTLPLSGVDRSEVKVKKPTDEQVPTIDLAKALEEVKEEQESVVAEMSAQEQAILSNDGERIQVLVVDDEPVNRQVLENHLNIAGYEVTQAADGRQALEYLSNGKKFDLVLLDIMMPKMNGYEVCNVMRENYLASELPVVMLTAKNQVSDLVDGFSAGANDYLTKPFAKDELLSRIRTQLNLRFINQATRKFVPAEFLKVLGKDTITEIKLGEYDEQLVTVLFTDIRSYTSLAESMSPEDNFRFVNAYNKRMGPIIQAHEGFVNQYYGDGIMAIFSNKPIGSVRAAIDMQLKIQEYNIYRQNNGNIPIRVGMGMHTGPLIMGIIGYGERLSPATISDTVNTASRVESLTKHFGANILLSEKSYDALDDREGLHFRLMGRVQMKGKHKALKIYECFDGDYPEMRELKLKTHQVFEDAISKYYDREFAEAKAAFEYILSENPDDAPVKRLLSKATELLTKGVPDDWDGVESMYSK